MGNRRAVAVKTAERAGTQAVHAARWRFGGHGNAIARQEKRRIYGFQINIVCAAMQQQMADIRCFLKTVIGGHAYKVLGKLLNFNALVGMYIRHIGSAYGEDNIVFVQHFIVLQVMQ